jgi:hypothetical protein
MNDCKYFDGCSAPMCPKSAGVAEITWFPDEDICRLQDVPDWVKRQRKIAKTGADVTAGYFTLAMLEHHCVIGKSITGIDPDGTDSERKAAEKNWLGKHPVIEPISDEEREKRAARMKQIRVNRYSKSDQKQGFGSV